MKREQFYNQLKSLRVPYRFTLRTNHFVLFASWQENPFKMSLLAFKFGFLQGQRAAEAEARAKTRRELEWHAPGYGHLMTLIERHRSNGEFVRWLLARALRLDQAIQQIEAAQANAVHGREGVVGDGGKT